MQDPAGPDTARAGARVWAGGMLQVTHCASAASSSPTRAAQAAHADTILLTRASRPAPCAPCPASEPWPLPPARMLPRGPACRLGCLALHGGTGACRHVQGQWDAVLLI